VGGGGGGGKIWGGGVGWGLVSVGFIVSGGKEGMARCESRHRISGGMPWDRRVSRGAILSVLPGLGQNRLANQTRGIGQTWAVGLEDAVPRGAVGEGRKRHPARWQKVGG